MAQTVWILRFGLAVWAAIFLSSSAAHSQAPTQTPVIDTSDVSLFYEIYAQAEGQPAAKVLQAKYLEAGSEGLRIFAKRRDTTGSSIAAAIKSNPDLYENARACVAVLPEVKARLATALSELKRIYPEARFPTVTIAIGRGRPVAIGYPDTGVQIGLEALCAVDFLNPDIEDRFVHVITHEFVHVQQAAIYPANEAPTVLEASLEEGAAEFITELVSGGVANAYFDEMVEGRKLAIERDFLADKDKTDLSDWLFNSTLESPGDLGYWVGYRITKAYYLNAADKSAAIQDILEITDAGDFLRKSEWQPGVTLN